MGLPVSLILIAVGAVLAWAVHVDTNGVNVHTIGYILLVVGIIGALLSMVFWSSWAGPGTGRPSAHHYVERRAGPLLTDSLRVDPRGGAMRRPSPLSFACPSLQKVRSDPDLSDRGVTRFGGPRRNF